MTRTFLVLLVANGACRSACAGTSDGNVSADAFTDAAILATQGADAATSAQKERAVDASDGALAAVILRDYDVGTRRATILPSDAGPQTFGIADRKGHVVWAGAPWNDLEEKNGSTFAPGSVQVKRHAFAGDNGVAWIYVGRIPGLCMTPIGFLATYHAVGGLPQIDAVGAWQGSCGSETPDAEYVRAGAGWAVLEPGSDAGESGPHFTWRRVWLERAGEIVNAGDVRIEMSDEMEPFYAPKWKSAMTATYTGASDGLHVAETWTFTPRQGGPPQVTKVERRYTAIDGKLVKSPTLDPLPK